MIGLGKCDSCSNKVICKFVEKMKEYEEGVQKNVIGEHTHNFGDFPLSIEVKCKAYKYNNSLYARIEKSIYTQMDNNDSDKTLFKSGLGYGYKYGDEPMPIYTHE